MFVYYFSSHVKVLCLCMHLNLTAMGLICWRCFLQVVAALAVDHSGSRVLSGSYDYTVRMYDFQGMNNKLASFRQLEPFEGHQVRSLSWSPTADRFLCVTGSAQAKVYFCCLLAVVIFVIFIVVIVVT